MSALKERCQSTMRSRGAVTTAPSPNRVSKGEIPPAPSRADQSAALFYYESTQHIKNKYITRDPSQPSLHSLCDSSKGWRDVNTLQAGGSQAPLCEGVSRSLRAAQGPRASVPHPLRRAGHWPHTKEPAAGAGRGHSPGSWEPHLVPARLGRARSAGK